MDLKSDLSWYGKTPPTVNYLHDNDAPGFTAGRQELNASQYKGIQGEEYTHTGVRQLGVLKFTDWFLNDHAKGFTGNMFPLGGAKKESQFVGIAGEAFTYTGMQELGNLQNNIYASAEKFKSRFIYNDDLTVSVEGSKGFNRDGTAVESPIIPISRDSFVIDDMTMSDRGLAKRKAQGGMGHPFTGTALDGNTYKWKPEVHTGWHPDNKYSDTVKKNRTAGLSDTYTAESPIDDLYNKLNLREDAHQTGYIKHPLILRGIQREGNTKNQRWGISDTVAGQISSTLDLPRGGILTSIERGVVDIARLAKFMVSPPGLAYMVKQLGMQLMNPNVEGADGKTQKPFTKNSTKLYTPVNTLLQPLAGIAGMHIKRHGLLPIDLPGGVPGTYEGVIDLRNNDGMDIATNKNRLVQLGKKYGTGFLTSGIAQNTPIGIGGSEFSVGMPVRGGILSGPTGPGSVGGIGSTIISRWSDTGLKTQLGLEDPKAGSAGYKYADYVTGYYTYGRPYLTNREYAVNDNIITREEISYGVNDQGVDPGPDRKKKINLARRAGWDTNTEAYTEADAQWGTDGKEPEESVMGTDSKARWGETEDLKKTRLNTYKAIRNVTKDRTPESSGILDFRTLKDDPKKPKIDAYDSKDKKLNVRGYPNFLPVVDSSGKHKERASQKDSFYGAYSQDLIKLRFNPIDPSSGNSEGTGVIAFRAYIDSLDDAFTPTWNTTKDLGAAYDKIQYTGFSRTLSISFKVPVTSKDERWTVWNRLNKLASVTLPIYATSGFTGQHIRVTVGDMYRNVPMYINDLTYSWDTESPWEITPGQQVPFITSVDMSLGYIGDNVPKAGTTKPYHYG